MKARASVLPLLLASAATAAQAQGPASAGGGGALRSLFRSVKPEATVVLKKHPTGADLVEVTVVRADYSPGALQDACERLGTLVGTPVRGLLVFNSSGFLKAKFATNGLIGPANDPEGRLHLAPVIKSFAFSPAPLRSLAVLYEGENADRTTIRAYRDEPGTLRVEAQRLPGGIEYRTFVDPKLKEEGVVLPGPNGLPTRTTASAPAPRDWTLPIVLGVAAIAAGGLVYSLASRRPAGTVRAAKGSGRPGAR